MDNQNHGRNCYFRQGALAPTQVTGTNLDTALQGYLGFEN